MGLILMGIIVAMVFLITQQTIRKFYGVIEFYVITRVQKSWADFSENLKELNRTMFKIKGGNLRVTYISVTVIFALTVFFFTGSIFLGVVFLGIGFVFPTMLIDMRRRRRAAKAESQLIDALTILCNSLKAGLDLVQGLEILVRDMPPPVSEEFGLVLQEYKLGASMESALYNLRTRMKSKYFNILVTAIVIQRESGGNIIKIISQVVESIREGYKLDGKVRTLTAQGKMQSWIILGLPWGMAMILFVVQPQFMMPMIKHPLGLIILGLLIFWQMIGMLVIKRLTIVKV